jgi:L-malate glycosyltransferase
MQGSTPEQHRILHLVHSDQRRGAEVFAGQLATCLENNGRFRNAVCALHQGNGEGLALGNLPVFRLGGPTGFFRKVGLDPRLLSRLLGAMGEIQPDIVVAHGSDTLKYSAVASLFYRRAAFIYRNIGTASVWANSPVKVGLNRLLLRRMNSVVSVSQYTRRDFINVYRLPEDRVVYIPNGVDAAGFDSSNENPTRTQVRRELGLFDGDLALISVGNLSEEKGHCDLLAVMGELGRTGLDYHLIIVGDGPLRSPLEEQARRLDLVNRVHFLGRRNDVPRLLAAADIFVLSSRTEGMPGVLVEAGLAGLPSVAFDVGGVAEVVEHGVTGLISAAGDLTGFVGALADLCHDPDARARMGNAARQRCQDPFDIRQVAQQYQELFLNILGVSPKEREWAVVKK